jgi:biotin-(acetyl-CoA carboxylase) ligase
MAALADAVAAAAPPETAIHIDWPDALYVNWGLIGGGRLAWPAGTAADKVPDWMVFGAMVRTASETTSDPGLTPDLTALEEEGFTEITSNQLIEGFARNLMLQLDAWQESSFAAVARSYCERLSAESGRRWEIDDNGDLIGPAADGAPERKPLLARLARPAWLAELSKDAP